MGHLPTRTRGGRRLLPLLWLFVLLKDTTTFHVTVQDDNNIVVSLEASDVVSPASVYVVKITGESKNYFFEFEEFNSTLPPPVIFKANYHGLYYIITLVVVNGNVVSKPSRSITVLTKPLPVTSVSIYDYKPSPETGVLFEIHYPEKYNVFTRVNISYWEGKDFRTMLYKAPYPPQNISVRIVNLNKNNWEEQSGSFPEESFMRSQDTIGKDKVFHFTEETSEIPSGNISSGWAEFNSSDYGTTSQPYWWDSASATPESEDEFVSVLPTEYNNTLSGMEKSTSASFSFLPVQMILSWLPPKPPTAFDGFHIRIEREENFTEYLTVDEEAHEFVAELKEPGKYKLSVTTFSSSGACETRKSQSAKSLSFYISPSGEWIEELTEKPQHVSVHVLSSTTALMSWTSSQENYNSTIVSVVSLTCQKQKESQRLEKQYCTQVNSSKPIIENLVPGAQYQVVMYLRKGPLIGPPSDPVTFAIVPTGIKDLMLYPLGPTAVVLSWTRPYLGVFRKYVVEMFYFNPSTMTSEWTTYYEIAATVSLTASVRIANLLPAWYYNFRVTMVTWGDPELSCCDSSTISFITAPVAPEITSVEYFNSLLYISWTYGDDTTDLSHSRMLHWMVVAEGKKKIKKSVTRNVMTAILSLPPGDIYNLSVTACTERGSNTSMLRLVKLECGAGTFVNFASLERDGKLPYNWSKNGLKKRKLTNPVQLDDFDAYIKDMAKDSDYKFSLQFEELKLIGLDIPHFAADLPLNRCKNRYTNILPYDFSRVRLVSMNEEEGADYINANYIPGYNSPQEYIATQGPLPETRNDFWKMVLQQKSHIIVMLTQCNEKRRVKCDHYWPFTEEPIAYGDITVEMISEEEQDDWACRHFRINYADEMQDVMHFNYTAWPDHGVPTANAAESILQFVYMVRQQATKSKGPMIIHCSAGVGRTGTFIALDRLLQHIRDHEFVDILGLVSEMRSYRMSMVQTEEQYIFIHQCVQLMWMKKKQQFCISDVIYENVTKS
uniref:Protein tyrosine phosphatase receptor type O n=1 Tax=Propithecus coquereli TaxID=379532 RepID=A0A2K6GVV5_PROCO